MAQSDHTWPSRSIVIIVPFPTGVPISFPLHLREFGILADPIGHGVHAGVARAWADCDIFGAVGPLLPLPGRFAGMLGPSLQPFGFRRRHQPSQLVPQISVDRCKKSSGLAVFLSAGARIVVDLLGPYDVNFAPSRSQMKGQIAQDLARPGMVGMEIPVGRRSTGTYRVGLTPPHSDPER